MQQSPYAARLVETTPLCKSQFIPNIKNNVEFGYVSSATNFSSSLMPCHAGNGHSFQTKNLCSFLAKLNVISDIWY